MTRHDTVLIAGATGVQGTATAHRLIARGTPVRALVRDAGTDRAQALADAGAELVEGDLDAPETLTGAVSGVHGVFTTTPAVYGPDGVDLEREFARGKALIDAAVAEGLGHFVFSSIATVDGPGLESGAGKRRIEAHLASSGLRWTVLRPVRFMENYLFQTMPVDGLQNGVHRHVFRADLPMQVVAVADIAEFAALAFADPDSYAGKALELAGDDPTPVEAAAAIGAATGRDVRYERIGRDEAEALGPEVAKTLRLTDDGHGWNADIPALRKLHPGLRSLKDWLAESGADAIKSLPGD